MSTDDPGDPRLETVERLLDDPALWSEVPSGMRERVVAAALAGADAEPGVDIPRAGDEAPAGTPPTSAPAPGPQPQPSPEPGAAEAGEGVIPHHAARRRREARAGRRSTWLAAAAAAAVLVVGVVGGLSLLGDDDGREPVGEVALTGTEDAPGASATASLTREAAGLSVVLDVSDLEPAPRGTFYEVWLVGESGKVSAGTFHMRGDQDEITMWWGVEPDGYDAVTVTRQPVDGGTTAEGVVVLRGELLTG